MITVETLSSELPDVEMAYTMCEEHVGQGPCLGVEINPSELDASQLTTYNNFMSLMDATNINEISNAPSMLYVNRGTSVLVTEGTTQKDYTADFDATQQGYIEAFVQLVMDLYE